MKHHALTLTLGLLFAHGVGFGQLDNILSPSRLPFLKPSKLYQISSYDTTGGNNDAIPIKKGQTAVIASIKGPGVITQFWCTIASRVPYFLRRLVLRMYWDGEHNPSVEVPVGDFFGTGFEYKHYLSEFVGMSSGGYYSYFPMPFNGSAKIEVVNETGDDVDAFYYHVDYQKLEKPLEKDVAYFHAMWHRDIRTAQKENYVILDAKGRGQYVGVIMSMQGYDGNLWFLEGDEMVYVDGEKTPSVHGTGTEDYFTSGWYFNKGEFAGLYHGLILKSDSLSRIAAYRFHVGDAIPFRKSIRFTIEHGTSNEEIADYSSTAFWYQKEPHQPFGAMLKPSLRIPLRVTVPNHAIEAESLSASGAGVTSHSEDMTDFGADWSGGKQLRLSPLAPGDSCLIRIPVKSTDRFSVDMYYTKGPDYGDAEIRSNGVRLAQINGYAESVTPAGKINLGHLKSVGKEIPLTVIFTGKENTSKGFSTGIDAFVVEPYREFITRWSIVGPFPNPKDSAGNRTGIDVVYAPEKEIDSTKTYTGVNDQAVQWKSDTAATSGFVDLSDQFKPSELVVAYARCYIQSPDARTVSLLVGSDDGVKVLLNGVQVHRNLALRGAAPDQDTVSLALKPGWNSLLLKIENNLGGYGFFARVLDPDHELIIQPSRKR